LSEGAAATDWIDGLINDGAELIIGYDHPHFGRFPTMVSNEHGEGRITTVGTVPNPALAADLLRWLIPIQDPLVEALPESVTVHSATNADGERIHVVHNWSWTPAEVTVSRNVMDILADSDGPIRDLQLGSWDVRILAG
jgi:beta-galactosidase